MLSIGFFLSVGGGGAAVRVLLPSTMPHSSVLPSFYPRVRMHVAPEATFFFFALLGSLVVLLEPLVFALMISVPVVGKTPGEVCIFADNMDAHIPPPLPYHAPVSGHLFLLCGCGGLPGPRGNSRGRQVHLRRRRAPPSLLHNPCQGAQRSHHRTGESCLVLSSTYVQYMSVRACVRVRFLACICLSSTAGCFF